MVNKQEDNDRDTPEQDYWRKRKWPHAGKVNFQDMNSVISYAEALVGQGGYAICVCKLPHNGKYYYVLSTIERAKKMGYSIVWTKGYDRTHDARAKED